MFFRKPPLTYDPKEFPNYRILFPKQQTGFERLIKQWPAIFHFFVYTLKLFFGILGIFFEYFCMLGRNPFKYNDANDWILAQFRSSTVNRVFYGFFLSFWFGRISLTLIYIACDWLVEAYEDSLDACHQVWDFRAYLQSILISSVLFILSFTFDIISWLAVFLFNMAWSLAILFFDMSSYSIIFIFASVILYQLHHYFFVYTPEEPPKEEIETPKPGRCFRVPTPSTSSSTSSSRSSPRRSPRPFKSNKPPGAAYVQVSPKALEELHSHGIYVPEPTRIRPYPELKPFDPRRHTNFHRVDIMIRSRRNKAAEELREEKNTLSTTEPSTVPTKNQWLYSSIASVERQLIHITQDVSELKMQVNYFRRESNPRPFSLEKSSLPGSPRSQQRIATLNEKERIETTKNNYSRKIEAVAVGVLGQEPRLKEALAGLDRWLSNGQDVTTSAMRGQVEYCRTKLELMFKAVEQAQWSARNIEEKCEETMEALVAEAAKLRRLDRTHVKGKRVSFALHE
ncbi:hypothetical protein FSARC_6094 [Fusarium sarcochroum]|uniref:Uncharacterized protein n=1 Tax=Fusarium sarcochroum TaxID=1208366 RepID=A0A8H4TYA9_9HYPO|nr:hypothetical protein FSARC_6094 [Fusarium sarcochroum]